MNYWTRGNVRLRNIDASDLEREKLRKKDPDSMREFLEDYIELPKSDRDLDKEFEEVFSEYSKEDKRIFIIESLEGDFAGMVSIWYTDQRNRMFHYGIYLESHFRGKQMAKDALVIVLDYYFNELNYHKASPMAYEFNIISQKFHEKFGFIKEGVLREELYTRGKFYDLICYGMTKQEFNSRYQHFDFFPPGATLPNFDADKQ